MGSTTRDYVKGNDPMWRSVTPYEYTPRRYDPNTREYCQTGETEIRYRYAGPYATRGPAMASRGPGGWVEKCQPLWDVVPGTKK